MLTAVVKTVRERWSRPRQQNATQESSEVGLDQSSDTTDSSPRGKGLKAFQRQEFVACGRHRQPRGNHVPRTHSRFLTDTQKTSGKSHHCARSPHSSTIQGGKTNEHLSATRTNKPILHVSVKPPLCGVQRAPEYDCSIVQALPNDGIVAVLEPVYSEPMHERVTGKNVPQVGGEDESTLVFSNPSQGPAYTTPMYKAVTNYPYCGGKSANNGRHV